MTYISFYYYLFVAATIIIYYLLPCKYRWISLLTGNIVFYMVFYRTGWWILLLTILLSYSAAILISKLEGNRKRIVLWLAIVLTISPWLLIKSGEHTSVSWIIPMGISFYTLQIISYLVDVYRGQSKPQKNVAKYALFISFFPQLIQGPIPRYGQLENQLVEGHLFDEDQFTKGIYLIIWGFFLKLVIADKAAVIVDTVFDNYPAYSGFYIWIAAVLYSMQLYTDFLACTTLAQGVSKLFGIELIDNFCRPYFATSVKEFWRRWHISLSSWLRDYIYIPLGGNRKGKCIKYCNLFITFLFSGMWHGTGVKFLIWGGVHAVYQIIGEMLYGFKEKLYQLLGISVDSKGRIWGKRIGTFLLVTFAWVIFRARTLRVGMSMIKHMFTEFNPWILFNDRIFTLSLEWKECMVLILAIVLFGIISKKQEDGVQLCDVIINLKLPVRWLICITAILGIIIFGTYGFGFNSQDFIYGGF